MSSCNLFLYLSTFYSFLFDLYFHFHPGSKLPVVLYLIYLLIISKISPSLPVKKFHFLLRVRTSLSSARNLHRRLALSSSSSAIPLSVDSWVSIIFVMARGRGLLRGLAGPLALLLLLQLGALAEGKTNGFFLLFLVYLFSFFIFFSTVISFMYVSGVMS